jgi:ketosteroid isomerase-like protein
MNDERAILNTLGDFARILDRKQWNRVGEVFADDVSFNYGDGREQHGIDAMGTQFTTFLDHCGPTQHLLGSIQLDIDGDAAVTRSYVQARHQGIGDKVHLFVDTNGEYTDRWERRPEGWRIVRRDARWDLFMGDMSVLYGPRDLAEKSGD